MSQAHDFGKGSESVKSVEVKEIKETGKVSPVWTIHKFNDEDGKVAAFTRQGHSADEASKVFADRYLGVNKFAGNVLLNGGITIMWNLIGAAGATSFTAAHARLGVGNDNTHSGDATQTGLIATGAANVRYQIVDSTTVTAQSIAWQATYTGAIANFLWTEFGADDDAVDGSGFAVTSYSAGVIGMMDRLVSAQGTKVAGQTWILTLTVTLS
jgi:hypothetical protein